MKINDIVRYKKFPFENDLFKIVGTQDIPWTKATPYKPGGTKIKVEKDKDFILLKKNENNYNTIGIDDNGFQVHKQDLELFKSP